ncbi:MAG: tryptophan-rich sensory protein [Simkaniaceae bacterium]|nr:MAG: tryptophan-rich sensory protein [Simkaniaceae bacterium]
MKKNTGILSLILWYLPVALVQLVSARVTVSSINPWYKSLNKAYWNPPAWFFGPTWAVLYIMMAIAVWIVYRTKSKLGKHWLAYSLFFTQLIANGLWSFLFFGLHSPGWALLDLTLLIILVAITSTFFFRIRRIAGFLLLPYLLWSIYALSLNIAIWWLN